MATGIGDLVNRFTWADYTVFLSMLGASAAIGIYYGCVGKKIQNTKDFLMAGKSMSGFPVAMSLIASFLSAISLLGVPSEIYQTGITYTLTLFAYITAIPLTGYIFLPLFWDLQLTSVFEYLELRFNKVVRIMGSLFFIIGINMYMAFVIYAPALALAQVTGLNVFLLVSLVTFVGMFYTALGGMKAVLWTDALQTAVMFGSVLLLVIKGTIDLGGASRVLEISSLGNRTLLWEFDPDPRVRHTFWGLGIGQLIYWFSIFGVNQTQVQRYLCVNNISTVRRLLWITGVGFCIIIGLCGWLGLLIYTKYVACDPISSGYVERPDQLLPFFVMDHFGHLMGFPGLFIAGIASGALSTVSSGINSLTAITLEDFLKAFCCTKITEKSAIFYSKIISIAYGLLAFLLVILASQLGDIVSTTNTLTGVIHGPILAVFSLGMFFPSANAKGAFIGPIVGWLVAGWIVLGQQWAIKNKQMTLGKLPINLCDNFTVFHHPDNEEIMDSFSIFQIEAEIIEPQQDSSIFLELYRLSYTWSSTIGGVVGVVIGWIVSRLTGGYDIKKLDPRLLAPITRKICSLKDIGIDLKPDTVTNGLKKKDRSEIFEKNESVVSRL